MKWRVLSGIAIGLALFSVRHEGSQTTRQTTAAACADGRSESDKAKEALAISKSNGRVIRSGCDLKIRTAEGEIKLTDDPRDEFAGTFVLHHYEGILPGTEFHVVAVQLYESRAYELIGPKGHSRLVGPPLIAPDRRRVTATSYGLVTGYVPNAVEIWNIESGYPRLELSLRTEDWGPSDAIWNDANTIRFVQTFLENGVDERERKGAQLRLTAAGWSFEPAKK